MLAVRRPETIPVPRIYCTVVIRTDGPDHTGRAEGLAERGSVMRAVFGGAGTG